MLDSCVRFTMTEATNSVRVKRHVPYEYQAVFSFICKYETALPVLPYWSNTITAIRQKANVKRKNNYLFSPRHDVMYITRIDTDADYNPVAVYWYNESTHQHTFFVIVNVGDRHRMILTDAPSKIFLVLMNHINAYFPQYEVRKALPGDETEQFETYRTMLKDTTKRLPTAPDFPLSVKRPDPIKPPPGLHNFGEKDVLDLTDDLGELTVDE